MSFSVLLLLGISTFVSQETKAAQINQGRLKARQNALIGLQVSLGQLQKYAGPDQRVSARTDILEPSSGGAGDLFTPVANPYYTAIWDVAGSEGNLPGEAPEHDTSKLPAILVSGNERFDLWSGAGRAYPDGYLSEAVALDPNASDVVDMVAAFTNEAGVDNEVLVKKQPLMNGSEVPDGHYAYWVGDEGIKARVNQHNPHDFNEVSEPHRWRQNHSASLALLNGASSSVYADTKYSNFDSTTSASVDYLEKLATRESLSCWGGWKNDPLYADIERQKIHDITLTSRGVLSDVRNGGLKKNLTPALMTNGAAVSGLLDDALIFPRASDDIPGSGYKYVIRPTWGLFRDYIDTANRYVTSVGSARVLDDYVRSTEYIETSLAKPDKAEISPVITRFQLAINPVTVGASAPYRIYVCIAPAVSLWNPYNVAMKTSNLLLLYKAYNSGGSTASLNGNDRFGLGLSALDGAVFSAPGGLSDDSSVEVTLPSIQFYIPETVIPPGRTVVFSPPNTSLAPFPVGPSDTLSPGFNPLGYYYHDTGIDYDKNDAGIQLNLTKSNGFGRIRTSSGMLHLLVPDASSGNSFTIRDDYILSQHKDLSAFSPWGEHVVSFESPETAVAIVGGGLASGIDTSGPNFQSPRLLIASAMKFATSDSGGLTADENSQMNRWLADHNPRATYTASFLSQRPNANPNTLFSGSLNVNSDAGANFSFPGAVNDPTSESAYTLVGGTWTTGSGGPERAVIFDLPVSSQRITAITQLAHANITSSTQYSGGGFGPHASRGNYPAFPLGNSYANPRIPPEALVLNAISDRTYYYDLSYFINDSLYDSYFMTGLRPSDAWSLTYTFPNSRLTEYGSPVEGDLKDYDRASAYLMIDGCFNVNSTSTEAWATFLGGLRGTDVSVKLDTISGGAGTTVSVTDTTPVAWSSTPFGGAIQPDGIGANKASSLVGFRSLTDSEIRWLAARMVEQVKARGPFPSMSAFVNRYFYSSSLYREDLSSSTMENLSLAGAIQGALDSQKDLKDSVNKQFWEDSGTVVDAGSYVNTQNPKAGGGLASGGTPGSLTQGHILSQIDSAVSVRSDTFIVRSYGDSLSVDGEVRGRAYCEAVVQRLPDYIDSTNNAYDEPAALSPENARFGRRFEIVSITWLDGVE